MLWRVPPETLERLLLPLGELTKPAVRAWARRAGLPPAGQPESQEVCFAPGDHREFLAARGASGRAGEIVDAEGACSAATTAGGGSRWASGAVSG